VSTTPDPDAPEVANEPNTTQEAGASDDQQGGDWLTIGGTVVQVPSQETTIAGGLAAVVAAVTLLALGGPVGGLAGVAVVATWYLIGPLFAFALGQVAVAAFAGGWPLTYLAVAEATVFAVLLAPDVASADRREYVPGILAWTLVVAATTYGAHLAWDSPLATAAVLVTGVALIAYGHHRYELVRTSAISADEDTLAP
jgi:hypothetical protein